MLFNINYRDKSIVIDINRTSGTNLLTKANKETNYIDNYLPGDGILCYDGRLFIVNRYDIEIHDDMTVDCFHDNRLMSNKIYIETSPDNINYIISPTMELLVYNYMMTLNIRNAIMQKLNANYIISKQYDTIFVINKIHFYLNFTYDKATLNERYSKDIIKFENNSVQYIDEKIEQFIEIYKLNKYRVIQRFAVIDDDDNDD